MAIFYLDTSALVKRYINEPGSAWVRQLCNARDVTDEPLHVLLVGRIAIVEVAAALSILERRNIILPGVARHAYRKFTDDWSTAYQIREITPDTLSSAAALARQHPLKAYDAVHLATALETQQQLDDNRLDLILVSGDTRLLQAAQREGLDTENPFAHAHLDSPPHAGSQ